MHEEALTYSNLSLGELNFQAELWPIVLVPDDDG
jgi:hypothetical protein